MRRVIPAVGDRFHFWTVIDNTPNKKAPGYYYLCRCRCGTEKLISIGSLRIGATKSCGCYKSARTALRNTSHGFSKTNTYKIYHGIKARCYTPSATGYRNYGGRGIKMCERWIDSFELFLEDVGEIPEGMEIDRIDNDGPYSPENCRIVSRNINSRNKRQSRFVSLFGETKTLIEWSEDKRCTVTYTCMRNRLQKGWGEKEAILTPNRGRRQMKSNKILIAWGERKTMADWAEDSRCQVSYGTLSKRMQKGWPPERAISRGPQFNPGVVSILEKRQQARGRPSEADTNT